MTTMNRELSTLLLNEVSEAETKGTALPTAHGMMGVRLELARLNLPVQYMVAGEMAMIYLVTDPSLKYIWEPVLRREQVDFGLCGVCYGMEFLTDFYFPRDKKVLDPYTMAAISYDGFSEKIVVHRVDVVPTDEQRKELTRRIDEDSVLHEIFSEMAIDPNKIRP